MSEQKGRWVRDVSPGRRWRWEGPGQPDEPPPALETSPLNPWGGTGDPQADWINTADGRAGIAGAQLLRGRKI